MTYSRDKYVQAKKRFGRGLINYKEQDLNQASTQNRLTADTLLDLEFSRLPTAIRWRYAHEWWALFWESEERKEAAALLDMLKPETDQLNQSKHHQFSSGDMLLFWLSVRGINPAQTPVATIVHFLLKVYPDAPEFIRTNTVADLIEFSAIFDFLASAGSDAARLCRIAFTPHLVVQVVQMRQKANQNESRPTPRVPRDSLSGPTIQSLRGGSSEDVGQSTMGTGHGPT